MEETGAKKETAAKETTTATRRAVLFDLDGTLLDTLEDLADSLNHVLAGYEMPARSLDEVRRFVGNGIHKLIERAVPPATAGETVEAVYRDFLRWYQDHCAVKTRPYEGMEAVLRALQADGWSLAVVSNKADGAVKSLCASYFPAVFDVALGDRPGVQKKPAPDSVGQALRQMGLDDAPGGARGPVYYVGDSDVDIETARNAGLPCISVTWGFRPASFLLAHGASCLVHRPEELLEALRHGEKNFFEKFEKK